MSKEAKILINIRLPKDVVNTFKKAALKRKTRYQKTINATLLLASERLAKSLKRKV